MTYAVVGSRAPSLDLWSHSINCIFRAVNNLVLLFRFGYHLNLIEFGHEEVVPFKHYTENIYKSVDITQPNLPTCQFSFTSIGSTVRAHPRFANYFFCSILPWSEIAAGLEVIRPEAQPSAD